MARKRVHHEEGPAHGMRLWMRFTLLMTLALAGVMSIAGYWLYSNASAVAERAQEAVMVESVRLTGRFAYLQSTIDRLRAERDGLAEGSEKFGQAGIRLEPEVLAIRDAIDAARAEKSKELGKAEQDMEAFWKRVGAEEKAFGNKTFRYPVTFGDKQEPGFLYRYMGKDDKNYELIVPADVDLAERGLLRVIVWSTVLVVLVGAGVAMFVASTVARPISDLVSDIHQISKGMLNHRARTGQGGEVDQLSTAINRMAKNLSEARETELALSIRERERAVAGEVREALISEVAPQLAGYDIGVLHEVSQELGGDFQDALALGDGRLGLLVCDVSGKGVPAALIGGMARAYLRSELARGGDVAEALRAANREIARDMRKGMFVTAIYVLVDPARHTVTVACAGHKLPLLRVAKSDGKLRAIQPEGLALGFDKGPVFDRRLEVQAFPFEPGDRLVLINTGTVAVQDGKAAEIGEKPLFAAIQRFAGQSSAEFLERLRSVLAAHAGGNPFPRDVSIVTIARE